MAVDIAFRCLRVLSVFEVITTDGYDFGFDHKRLFLSVSQMVLGGLGRVIKLRCSVVSRNQIRVSRNCEDYSKAPCNGGSSTFGSTEEAHLMSWLVKPPSSHFDVLLRQVIIPPAKYVVAILIRQVIAFGCLVVRR